MSLEFKCLERLLSEIGSYQIATKNMNKRSYELKILAKEKSYTIINDLEIDLYGQIKNGFVNMGMFTNEFGSVEKIKFIGFENIEEVRELLVDIKNYSPVSVLHRLNKLKSRNKVKYMNKDKVN